MNVIICRLVSFSNPTEIEFLRERCFEHNENTQALHSYLVGDLFHLVVTKVLSGDFTSTSHHRPHPRKQETQFGLIQTTILLFLCHFGPSPESSPHATTSANGERLPDHERRIPKHPSLLLAPCIYREKVKMNTLSSVIAYHQRRRLTRAFSCRTLSRFSVLSIFLQMTVHSYCCNNCIGPSLLVKEM